MSLDDLIAKKKTSNKKSLDARPSQRHDSGGRGARGTRGKMPQFRAGNRRRAQPYSRPRNNEGDDEMEIDDEGDKRSSGPRRHVVIKNRTNGKGSIFSRLGEKEDSSSHGTKITVKNLNFDILEDDLRQLFSTVGEIKKAEIVYDRSGRSKGIARVWFARRSDAGKAIKQYDGRTLDGLAMEISLDSNVRKGLFGTALESSSGMEKDVKFRVSFGGGRGNGRNGGRGRGFGNRGNNQEKKTAEELDNDMDAYMNDAQ